MSDRAEDLVEWLVGNAKRAWLMRVFICAAIVAVPILLWSFSDKHNDARYVGKIEHAVGVKQQEEKVAQIATDLTTKTEELARSLGEQKQMRSLDHDKLIEIGQDIKWLKNQKEKEIFPTK